MMIHELFRPKYRVFDGIFFFNNQLFFFDLFKDLMPCPFTGPEMFCSGPNFLSQPKNLTAFSASTKTFVPGQKTILLNANHLFVWRQMFVTGTVCE